MFQHPKDASTRLNEEEWDVIDEAARGLEESWLGSKGADITRFVPKPDHPLRERTLIELIKVDQEYRWEAGQQKKLEEYLGEWPELDGRTDAIRELLESECRMRAYLSQAATADELRQRFPDMADQIDLKKIAIRVAKEYRRQPRSLCVNCPHCHNPVEIIDDLLLGEISCPSCDSSFNLVGEETRAENPYALSRKIGRFELLERLGEGSFGSVWRARDTKLDCIRAIKIPRKSRLDKEECEKFLREARAAAQLHHPNIVGVHEVGVESDTVYIVSDYIEGLTLDKWTAKHKPTHDELAELCVKLAESLHHAHENEVIHRDLKPANVIISTDGEPHVMDFGLAKRESGEITMTIDGQILGTPAYMPPEQAAGSGHDADRRSDVYSLGVILFELLTGEKPFSGNVRMLVKQVIEDDPPRPRKLDNRIPRDLETICLKCLEKSPERRYSSTLEMADELRRYLRGEPIHARPVGCLGHLWRCCRRNPLVSGLMAAFVVTMLAAVAISTYFAITANQPPRVVDETPIKEPDYPEIRDVIIDGIRGIPTQGIVTRMQFGPDDGHVYACATREATPRQIQKIDLASSKTEVIIKAPDLKHEHKGFALSADGQYAYVTNYFLWFITRFDLKQNNSREDLPIGEKPKEGESATVWASWLDITPDQSKLVVCLGNDGRSNDLRNDQLSIVDITDGRFRLAGEVLLDDEYGTGGVAFSDDSKRAYCVTRRRRSESATLYEVALDEPCRVTRRLGFPEEGEHGLKGVAVSSSLGRIWLSQARQKQICVLDLESFERTGCIELDGRTPGFLILNDDENLLAAICPDSGEVLFIDPVEGCIVAIAENISQPIPAPIFSPDGKSLLIARSGAIKEIAVIPLPKPSYQIVFASDRTGGYELYTMNTNEKFVTRLTDNRVSDWAPRWSTDGRRIAFVSDRKSGTKVCVMNRDGTQVVVLANTNPIEDPRPQGVTIDWSPNGQSIVFVSDRYQIRLVDVATDAVKTLCEEALVDPFSHHNGLCWRKSDGVILVSSQHPASGYQQHLFTLDPKTSTARRLTGDERKPGSAYLAPAASPDGQKIAVINSLDLLKTGLYKLCILDAKSKNPTTLVQREDGIMCSPRWAPDGKSIVYSAQVDGFQHLFLVPAAGGEPIQLTAGDSNNIDPDIFITAHR